jgi:hypothetical protein
LRRARGKKTAKNFYENFARGEWPGFEGPLLAPRGLKADAKAKRAKAEAVHEKYTVRARKNVKAAQSAEVDIDDLVA